MDKNSYALGMSIAHNMMSSGIKSVEFDDFVAGVKAILTGSEPAVSFQEAGQLLDKYFAEIEAEQKAEAEAMSAALREEGEGTFLNGATFDSSYKRGEPATFGLNQVIKGWTEGVQLMSEGSKYEFYIPYDLAYGEHGAPGAIPPYATLKFVVELIEVL